MISSAEHSKKIGLRFRMYKPDWDLITRRMQDRINESNNIEANLSEIKSLRVYKGTGEFTGEKTMIVRLPAGSFNEEFKG